MTTKTVKLSEENYRWLCEVAGNMQAEEKRTVSLDDALRQVKSKVSAKQGKFGDLIGSWKMSDKEAKDFMRDLRRDWKKWTKSA